MHSSWGKTYNSVHSPEPPWEHPVQVPGPAIAALDFGFCSDFDRLKTMLVNQWKSPSCKGEER